MEYIESQLRQKFASAVWTHKIQEKQADYYKRLYNIMETVRIILSAIITSGIILSIFVDKTWLKVITAIISMGTLFISTYLKSYDLKGLHQKHKETAIQLLDLREEIISVLCDIKWKKIDEEQLADKRDEINTKYLERISVSNYKNKFVLKGGMLITAIVGIDMRNTLDMDATIKGFNLKKDNLAYNLETVIADKFETIILINIDTTRARDFYDVYILWTTQQQNFDKKY